MGRRCALSDPRLEFGDSGIVSNAAARVIPGPGLSGFAPPLRPAFTPTPSPNPHHRREPLRFRRVDDVGGVGEGGVGEGLAGGRDEVADAAGLERQIKASTAPLHPAALPDRKQGS